MEFNVHEYYTITGKCACIYRINNVSTVVYFSLITPRGVRLKCYYAFFLVCCCCDTSFIVSVHNQFQTSIYTLSLCRGQSWRVRLAKQETLTPPGHLVSSLVCRARECPPWCSHQFFCFLHFCHTCSLCRVALVVQFPARGSTQVLLCLFPGVLLL